MGVGKKEQKGGKQNSDIYIAPLCFEFFLMKEEVKSFKLENSSELFVVL